MSLCASMIRSLQDAVVKYSAQMRYKQFSFVKMWLALKRAVCCGAADRGNLTSETVQGAALTFQCVDDVHGGDGLALGVLGVGDSITDDVLEEDLEYTASLLVDETRDSLDSTTASQTTDCRLGDTLDVITQNFAMTLSATLSKTLSSFAATRHV